MGGVQRLHPVLDERPLPDDVDQEALWGSDSDQGVESVHSESEISEAY